MQIIKDYEEVLDTKKPFNDDITGNRKDFGSSLLNVVNKCGNSQPLVIGLDGQWGDGKTYFLKRWRQELENNSIKTIYLDAFRSDYTDDPFFSIISEIYEFLEEVTFEKEKDENKDTFIEKLNDFSAKSLRTITYINKNLADAIIGHSTLGAINLEKLEIAGQKYNETEFEEKLSEFFKSEYSNYLTFKKDFDEFKKCLFEFAQLNFKVTNSPIIFIIDELDRCKPTYALDLLEKIKHFFSVEGIVFILSMNKNQLTNSIRNIYGINSDAELYLQKFITLDTSMPKKRIDSSDLSDYYNNLCTHYMDKIKGNKSYISIFSEILHIHNTSFRDCQKIFTYYAIIVNDNNEKPISFLLAVLKVKKPKIYTKFKNKDINHSDFMNEALNYDSEKNTKVSQTFIAHINHIFDIKTDGKKETVNHDPMDELEYLNMKHYLDMCNLLDLYHIN